MSMFFTQIRVACFRRCVPVRNLNTLLLRRNMKMFRNFHLLGGSMHCSKTLPKEFFHFCAKVMSTPVDSRLTAEETDPVTQAILDKQTTNELLNLFNEASPDLLNQEHAWLITTRLLHLHYKDLLGRIPWLQTNLLVAHIQLQLRDDVRRLAMPLLMHKSFPAWRDLLEKHCDSFSNQQLADCFMSTLFMGFSFDDSLMQNMLYRVHDRLVDFDAVSLMTISNALKSLPSYDYIAIRGMTKRFETIIDTLNGSEASEKELTALATICTNHLKFFGQDLTSKITNWFLAASSRGDILENPDSVSTFLRMGQKLELSHNLHNPLVPDFVSKLVNACYKLVDRLDSGHVADICHSLKLSRRYEQDLAKIFEERAGKLLTDGSRLCEITDLMYALSRSTSKHLVRRFEGALHSKLIRQSDVDILLLSNIAECLVDIGQLNRDLLHLFQKLVVARADNIITYISRYNKIVKLLVRHRFSDPALETQFMNALLGQLDHQHGLHLHSISSIAIFMLPFSYKALPDEFFNKLIIAIPKWKVTELYRLALGINSMNQPVTGILRRQMLQILSALHSNIADRISSVETIDYLYQLTLGLVIHNRNRDPVLTDQLMALYPKFTKNLNDVSLVKVAQIFHKIQYHLPEVYDDMVRFLVNNRGSVDDREILWVIGACAKVGYHPENSKELLELGADVFKKLIAEKDFRASVKLLNDLGTILLYPEQEIASLFTLEMIEEIERYLEDNSQFSKAMEQNLMELNRSVVLDCPQLDVPWFHEQYCLDNVMKSTEQLSVGDKQFKQDVYAVLCDVLGGEKFVRNRSFSTYFYGIDFECAFDQNQKPVSKSRLLTGKSNDGVENQLQKVALMILPDDSYCHNSKMLNGTEHRKKRHLEIMGYKYVEIPYFEWYSMGMAEWKSKVEYMRAKIKV